jgi:hypothetical protein
MSLVPLEISGFLTRFLLIVLLFRLTFQHVKKFMDVEFARCLMVPYSVNKASFGKGRSGFDPDFRHVYTNVVMQRD